MTDAGGDRELRASDREREEAAARLKGESVAGRITTEELEERLEGVMAARTRGELARYFRDLPAARQPVQVAERSRPQRFEPPGVLPFTHTLIIHAPPERVRALALSRLAPRFNESDFKLSAQSADLLTFENTSRPAWTILVAIVGFPFGLLALLPDHTERITITLEPRGEGETVMRFHGKARRSVRKALLKTSIDG